MDEVNYFLNAMKNVSLEHSQYFKKIIQKLFPSNLEKEDCEKKECEKKDCEKQECDDEKTIIDGSKSIQKYNNIFEIVDDDNEIEKTIKIYRDGKHKSLIDIEKFDIEFGKKTTNLILFSQMIAHKIYTETYNPTKQTKYLILINKIKSKCNNMDEVKYFLNTMIDVSLEHSKYFKKIIQQLS